MADVWLGRFSRWVEKLLNIKGGPALVDLSASVMPTLALDKGVDHRYLEGWNRFAVLATQAAVAAQTSRFRIRNPTTSNVIIVLEQLAVYAPVGGTADTPFVTWGAAVGDLGTLVTLSFARMDPRGQPTPTGIVSVTAGTSTGQAFLARTIAVNANADFITSVDQEIPILPGQVVDVDSSNVNIPLNVNVMWRERALESSELN